MSIKRKTINLTVTDNTLIATDSETGEPESDAGMQGEDCAVWLHVEVPSDWLDLSVRLQVLASNGECDESGLPLAGAIDMPIRSLVTVPGLLTVTLTGASADGVRRTAQCQILEISPQNCPADAVAETYPLAFEDLYNKVTTGVVHNITGSGGAKVTKTDDTTFDINVEGLGGDMLQTNYYAGTGSVNNNKVDHAVFADSAGTTANVAHADSATNADHAAAADSAASGSALETVINSKQNALVSGGNGGTNLLSGTTIKSLKGNGLTLTADYNSVTLSIDGAAATSGMIAYFAQEVPPDGWIIANGQELPKSSYPNLYDAIGDRYGLGIISKVEVQPTYLANNGDSYDNSIILQKYASGIQGVSYFATSGTAFTGETFDITTPGIYTIYCKNSSGAEAVQIVYIPAYTSSYFLNISNYPVTSDYKLTVLEQTTQETPTVNLVKMDAGIHDVSYFASSGITIGTQDSTEYIFQDGGTMPSGNYTWYIKDSFGNEAIQYFTVNARPVLSINICITAGSNNFRVPSLIGTINSLLMPFIKT